jgi:Tfp pilus assembly PilM family ATPase
LSIGMKIDSKIPFGRTVLAIEPGNEWVKLVQVTRSRDSVKINRVVVKRTSEVESLTGPALLKALGVVDGVGTSAVICLPRQAVNVRLFDLPSGDAQEIADMVDLQISRQTPYSRDEIVFDYRVFRSDKEGYTRVMLVIAQSGVVRQKYRFLEEAGLAISLVTTTADGWLAAMQGGAIGFSRKSAGATVFLDVDTTTSDLVVLNQGVPLFSRSLSIGASQLSEGDEGLRDKAVQEITMALETFRNEVSMVSIGAVVLPGLVANPPAYIPLLESRLGLEIVMAGLPMHEGFTPSGIPAQEGQGGGAVFGPVSLTGIIGAAAVPERLQINLTPDSVRLRKAVLVKASQLTLMACLIMAICGLLSLFVISRLHRQQVYLDELGTMIEKTTPDAERIDAMRRKVVKVADRMSSSMIPARALAELFGLAPDTMAFTSIQITDAAQLVCRGSAETVADTVRLVNAMEASVLFRNVKSTRTVSGKDRTEFEIACDLERRRP